MREKMSILREFFKHFLREFLATGTGKREFNGNEMTAGTECGNSRSRSRREFPPGTGREINTNQKYSTFFSTFFMNELWTFILNVV